MNTYQGGRKRPRKKSLDCVCAILSYKFLKLYMYHTLKKLSQFQKQPPEVFYRKKCPSKFLNIHRKTPVQGSAFNRVIAFKTCNFIKKRLQHRCFPANIAKNFRNTYFEEICEQLLLTVLLLTDNILLRVFLLLVIQQALFEGPLQGLKSSLQGAQRQASLLFEKKEKQPKWSLTCSLLLVVPLVSPVISLAVTRCKTFVMYNSL